MESKCVGLLLDQIIETFQSLLSLASLSLSLSGLVVVKFMYWNVEYDQAE